MNTVRNLSVDELFIAPSLLAADFANLQCELTQLKQAGIKILHLDIMDGHFVPNLTMGPPVVKSIRTITDMVFDVHLMLTNPINFVEPFAKVGADHITFHVECDDDVEATIKLIKKNSMSVGLSVKPNTSVEKVYPYLDDIDLVLIMTVEPGFGGQSFMADMVPKIEMLRKKVKSLKKNIHIQVDGGIASDTIAEVVKAGANIMVAGNSAFRHKSGIKNALCDLQKNTEENSFCVGEKYNCR